MEISRRIITANLPGPPQTKPLRHPEAKILSVRFQNFSAAMNFLSVSFYAVFIISLSSASHDLESYLNLKKVSRGLCPKQVNSTVPKCVELVRRLEQVHDLVLSEVLDDEGSGGDEEGSEDDEPLKNPLLSTTFDILEALERSNTSSCADLGKIAKSILKALRRTTTYLEKNNQEDHYLTLFIFSVLILGLLLFFQVYTCVYGFIKERKIRKANREVERARSLYENLHAIHRRAHPVGQPQELREF